MQDNPLWKKVFTAPIFFVLGIFVGIRRIIYWLDCDVGACDCDLSGCGDCSCPSTTRRTGPQKEWERRCNQCGCICGIGFLILVGIVVIAVLTSR